jgi:hypothetical protein
MNTTCIDKNGNNCLLLACGNNNNLDIIKYLIEDVRMDCHYLNYLEDNCLTTACWENTNLEIIKYLIEDKKININHVDNNNNNCLLSACNANTNLDVIKYLIEEKQMDVTYLNINGENCLTMACSNNTNISIIKYLIEDIKMNILHTNNIGSNCLLRACRHNTNLSIIKYLIEDIKMNILHTNNVGSNCLLLACNCNTNLSIIKYLIEDKKMDITINNNFQDNCLTLACWQNENLEIIKYLIEEKGMKTIHVNSYGNNCLILACQDNTNLEIIKYLIEDIKMNIMHFNKCGKGCFILTCQNNTNPYVAKYLVEETNAEISLRLISFDDFKKFINLITKNYDRLNELLENAINKYSVVEMKDILDSINPLILNETVRTLANIHDPFDTTYEKFVINVDNIKYFISVRIDKLKTSNRNEKKRIDIDFSKGTEILFAQNGISYYGHKNAVYNAMYLMNDSHNYAFDETIILSGNIPGYVMSMYIQSCYDGIFNLNEIKTNDFEPFLKFIDQYPTKYLSIDLLEVQLLKYIDDNIMDITLSEKYVMNVINRYKLKYLYLYSKGKVAKLEILK